MREAAAPSLFMLRLYATAPSTAAAVFAVVTRLYMQMSQLELIAGRVAAVLSE